MTESEYKDVLDKLATPVVVATPVYGAGRGFADDFTIQYVNNSFTRSFPGIIAVGARFSAYLPQLSKEIDWLGMANTAMQTAAVHETTFYSPLFSCWLRIFMNVTEAGKLIFSAVNVDEEHKREEKLRSQNAKLEAVTNELSLSKENLRAKLVNIEQLNSLLQFNAHHDSMTGLFTKDKLSIDLDDAIKENVPFGIILIDIDNLKVINDSQGHSAGDSVIKTAASIFKQIQKDGITFYRFGGDEFVVLVKNVENKDTLLTIGDLALELLNEYGVTFSGGIALFPDDTLSKDELLQFADMALTDIKKKGKNDIGFFQNVMQEKFSARMSIQTKLSDAISNDMFQLYFQPQFIAATGELRGFEALLRWHDDKFGWISPEKFIPIAEESQLVVPIGTWVMKTALKTLHEWKEKYGFDGIMSVNVSPIQLKKPDFLFEFKNMVREADIDTKNLEIEITEGIFIENKDEMLALLNQIRAMGIGISLDDFGTGYSSLSYLQLLPITTLKIDKSFIANITEESGIEANITDSIVSMVTKMGLDTIAEGVETEEQLNLLKHIQCKTVQGFLKGKPMSMDRCSKFLSGELAPVTIMDEADGTA